MRGGNMTKSEITERLNTLKRAGWVWKHFNYHKRMPSGAKGFVDHHGVSTNTGHTVYIEDKLSRGDMLSTEQEKFKLSVIRASRKNKFIRYWNLDDSNLDEVMDVLAELSEL
jgi:hypothetical protein